MLAHATPLEMEMYRQIACMLLGIFFFSGIIIMAKEAWRQVHDRRLRKLVWAAMDNGEANGFSSMMLFGDVNDVAIDMIDYDADILAELTGRGKEPSVMALIDHIEGWRDERLHADRA